MAIDAPLARSSTLPESKEEPDKPAGRSDEEEVGDGLHECRHGGEFWGFGITLSSGRSQGR